MFKFKDGSRVVQETVPGKQVTLAHIVARPDEEVHQRLELPPQRGAIGILRLTPSMTAIIAADLAAKEADVEVPIMDRFSGSVVVSGDVAAVESALRQVQSVLCGRLGFAPARLTRT